MPQGRDDEERLTADIIELARQYGRYGYRKIAELLRRLDDQSRAYAGVAHAGRGIRDVAARFDH